MSISERIKTIFIKEQIQKPKTESHKLKALETLERLERFLSKEQDKKLIKNGS